MLEIDYEQKESHSKSEFDPFEDIQFLARQENMCIVRTPKLLPTLQFMQRTWWKLWELLPDDEWWKEYNILTYYKPKCKTT